jgi:hypothetical protein
VRRNNGALPAQLRPVFLYEARGLAVARAIAALR